MAVFLSLVALLPALAFPPLSLSSLLSFRLLPGPPLFLEQYIILPRDDLLPQGLHLHEMAILSMSC